MRARPNVKPALGARPAGNHPAANSLVSCWLFNEGGSAIVRDCADINHATVSGSPTWGTYGAIGDALTFSGGSGASNASPRDLPTGSTAAWAMEIWVRMTASPPNLAAFYGFGADPTATTGSSGNRRHLLNVSGDVYFWGEGADWDTGVLWKTDGKWHQYILANPGGSTTPTLALLIDGLQVATGTPGGAFVNLTSPRLDAGHWDFNSGTSTSFGGQMACARLYRSDIRWLAPQLYRSPWAMFPTRPRVMVTGFRPPKARIACPTMEDETAFRRRFTFLGLPNFRIARALYRRPEPIDEFPARIFCRPRMVDFGRRYSATRGLYRIFNTAGYRFYRSSVAPPAESDSPFATSATLPATPVDTYANGTWYLSASYFNGVLDSGFLPLGPHGETYLTVEIAGGIAQPTRPSGPTSATLQAKAGGVIRVNAFYVATADGTNRATEWTIAYTTNGTTPPNDTPTIVRAMTAGSLQVLAYDLPAQADGTTVKVQLQTRRGGSVYSLPSTVLTAIADAAGPTAPLALTAWPGSIPDASE